MNVYRQYTVDVGAGTLTAGEWRSGDRPVLAIHGVSSTHKLWLWTAARAEGLRFIAPDLRGRGASQGFPRRFGLATHVEDVVALLDHLGLDRVPVAGMSLGAFIAVQLAASHPERVERLLLVDGGLPGMNFAALRSLTREQIAGIFKDRLQRLDRPWPNLAAYRDFFVGATAPLLDPSDPTLEEYLRYDLVGAEPGLRVRLDGDALVDDAADLYLTSAAEDAAGEVRAPVRLLYAQWSVGRDSPPSYTAEYLDGWAARMTQLSARRLPGTDHAATVMTPDAGGIVAREIEAMVGVAT